MSTRSLHRTVGTAAILTAVLIMVADLIELTGGGFSPLQLYLAYVAFTAVPFVVLGLHAVQQPRGGWLSLGGALLYGAAFVFFASTCIYALAADTAEYVTLFDELRALYTLHGIMMVAGGVVFGAAVVRAVVLPAWTGWAFGVGVLLNVVFSLTPIPQGTGVALAAAVRSLALIGMGIAVLRGLPEGTSAGSRHSVEVELGRVVRTAV